MHLGYRRRSRGKFHLLIVFEYYTWIPHWPQETNGLCSQFLPPPPNRGPVLAQSGNTREQASHLLKVAEHTPPRCRFAHWHSSPWNKVLAPFSFQDFVLGELEHLSADHLPLRIWARLTGSSALIMMWLMDKIRKNIPKNISVWSGVSASLHQVAAEGIFCCMPHYTVMAFPEQSCFFSWHKDSRQLYGRWAHRARRKGSTKERSFPKVPQVAFCCHELYESTQYEMGMRDFSD